MCGKVNKFPHIGCCLSLNTEENLLPKWLFIDEEKEVEKLIFNFKGGNSSLLLLNRREEDGKSYHH